MMAKKISDKKQFKTVMLITKCHSKIQNLLLYNKIINDLIHRQY